MTKNIDNEEQLIWHYTSADVFMEFMKDNSCLYATHHNFLNDAEEINYGCKLCMQILRQDANLSRYSDDVEKEIWASDVFCVVFQSNQIVYTNGAPIPHWEGLALDFQCMNLRKF